ncbi:carbonic anhydrase [Pseudomonas corrugata]|uniref:carbonic anhydrase n=1 Tax=Pseudomonas corrugata TaxID=47879 RepID=UPI0006D8C1A9|nr:carbonic anhydrase [Pseudomonas corrugata]
MPNLNDFSFKAQPGFNEPAFREVFAKAVNLRTIVIHCFDPRASEIPQVVAAHFGDDIYPGENVLDAAGNRVGHTTTLFPVSVAGGRAVAGLQSIATMVHLFGIERVVVVHHSFCGATSFTNDGIVGAFKHEHGSDISSAYDHDSVCIEDFEKSLKYDVAMVRANPGVPKEVKIYGFFYNIDTGKLIEVVEDLPADASA